MKLSILTFILRVLSLSQSSDDLYLKEYLESLKISQTPVFYSECRLPTGKAVLMFPVGHKQGMFIERVGEGIVNSADVVFADGKWTVDEALGGVSTILRVNRMVGELANYPFQVVIPENRGR